MAGIVKSQINDYCELFPQGCGDWSVQLLTLINASEECLVLYHKDMVYTNLLLDT